MRYRLLLLIFATALIATAPIGAQIPETAKSGGVVVVAIDGPIGPATAAYLHRAFTVANARGATCIVITIDTPGGLSDAMRDINKDILASPIPVVVYVSPAGARAASAGALITLAAHVAAMAPGTNIGAAHPVAVGGGETNETMQEKVTNDAAAYARGLATQRGRNVSWAERVVRESISSTAQEAADSNVIDLVTDDLDALLTALDGKTVTTSSGERTLDTLGAEVVHVGPTARERFLATISDPNIAYLLMLLGVFGIFFELQNPGAVFPGVIGIISLLVAAFALQMLPVNYAGVALMILALVLFFLEIKVPSHGALTVGGVVAMTIGSIMLIDSPLPFMRVSLSVIIPAVIVTALFFLFAVGLGLRAQRHKVSTGVQGLTGETGVARTDIHESGSVFIHGEFWNAWSRETIPVGEAVEVVAVDGMKIEVRPTGRKEVS